MDATETRSDYIMEYNADKYIYCWIEWLLRHRCVSTRTFFSANDHVGVPPRCGMSSTCSCLDLDIGMAAEPPKFSTCMGSSTRIRSITARYLQAIMISSLIATSLQSDKPTNLGWYCSTRPLHMLGPRYSLRKATACSPATLANPLSLSQA